SCSASAAGATGPEWPSCERRSRPMILPTGSKRRRSRTATEASNTAARAEVVTTRPAPALESVPVSQRHLQHGAGADVEPRIADRHRHRLGKVLLRRQAEPVMGQVDTEPPAAPVNEKAEPPERLRHLGREPNPLPHQLDARIAP